VNPVLTPAELNAFLGRAFPGGDPATAPEVAEVAPGRVVVRQPWAERMLRPGGVLSGPTMMSLADTAAYAVVLAHIGLQPMAVTSGLTINFLRPCKPGTLTAEAVLLKLGRRLAVIDVRMGTEGPDRPAAQASVTYALPEAAA
jgi:uncharacterized protein (TIGR00369 family)